MARTGSGVVLLALSATEPGIRVQAASPPKFSPAPVEKSSVQPPPAAAFVSEVSGGLLPARSGVATPCASSLHDAWPPVQELVAAQVASLFPAAKGTGAGSDDEIAASSSTDSAAEAAVTAGAV